MIYAYRCEKCGNAFTVRATVAEKTRGLDVHCPACGAAEVTQDLRGVGMVFGGGQAGPGCGSGPGCC